MGIDVRMETEDGRELKALLDPQGLVNKLLPDYRDANYSCLRFVDPYGDTTFNQLQMPHLVDELKRVLAGLSDKPLRAQCAALLDLAEAANGKVHTYLKFYGA